MKQKLVQRFNDHYINIAERSCGFKPEQVEFDIGSDSKNGILSSILDKYQNHPSIVEVHKNMSLQSSSISIPSSSWDSKVTPKQIKTILKFLNSKKAPEIDKIPNKLAKLASDISAKPLSIAINNSISTSIFPSNAKIAYRAPNDKKADDKYVISNFGPVSILNCFKSILKCY